MKLSLSWLSDFVDLSENDPQMIANALTHSVAEVEEVEIQGSLLKNCCMLKETLEMNDVIFHIDNHAITHRADLFSHIGFARECVAIGLGKWKKTPKFTSPKFTKNTASFKFIIDHPKGMPRYCACMVEIDDLGETPDWMKRRLISTGWRPLNLPIDITNYVMMEIGVPLHSFDADDFKGDVHMRKAGEGEKIITLDETERELNEGALVLSDDNGIFDLLGVMGGLRSSTKNGTRRIYLHSASLDPVAIRNTVMATGHRTDAATVYEKGVPHIIAEQGFYRAIELFLELVPGAHITSRMESIGDNGEAPAITFPIECVSKLLGREVAVKEITKVLDDLDFTTQIKDKKEDVQITVTPPLHRLGDIEQSVDIIEEIARITGFDSYKEEMPVADITPPHRNHHLNDVRDALKEERFFEVVQYAFLGEDLLQKYGFPTDELEIIENPIGEDMSIMRPSLIPRLLAYSADNYRLAGQCLRLFEVGHIFPSIGEEYQSLGLLLQSPRQNLKYSPILELKQILNRLCGEIGLPFKLSKSKNPSSNMHPSRSMDISVHGKKVGALYEVHPSIVKKFNLIGRTAITELNVEILLAFEGNNHVYKTPSEFPSITYDSTIVLDAKVETGELIKKVRKSDTLLQFIHLVDVFEKDGNRHCTFRCVYGSSERTLTEGEVQSVHKEVEKMLASKG